MVGVDQGHISAIELADSPSISVPVLNRLMHALKLTDAERIELLDLAPGAPVADTVAP